jgi:hypothetical protein
MATVPLTPQEGLEIGSAPQFSSGRIEPIQDTVTDDLQNFAKAQQDVSAIAFKLQDEDVIDKLDEDAEWGEIEKLFKKLNPILNPKDANKLQAKVEKDHMEHNQGVINDTLIANNSNQNNGKFLDQANTVFSLSSNNTTSNGIGGSVKDGFNSNDEAIDITGSQRNERIELLQQIVSTSGIYKKMIPQHQSTHVFAIQKLGVSKADSLYRKAEREYELPEFKNTFPNNKAGRRKYKVAKKKFEEEFLKNPDNEKIIKAAILDKYNEFVLDATGDKYNKFYGATKTIFPNPPKRSDFGTGRTGGAAYSKAVKEFYQNPDNAIKQNPGVRTEDLEFFTGEKRFGGRTGQKDFDKTKADKAEIYQNKVANDLEVLKKNVDYDYNPDTDETIIVDEVTGLQPKEKLVEKLKDTVIDEEELDYALKDLDIKYSKIENKTKAIYNQAFNNAKEIAFAEPGGWQNLIANNISIDNFTEQDQEILKNGQPVESDVDTEFELKSNPAEVATNLESHSHKLSNGQYLELKRYADSLRSEDSVVEATGNVTMLKATLDRYDMGDLYTSKNKEKKKRYIAINDAWLKEINARQIAKGNVKLTMGEKQAALNDVLLDNVNVDNDPFLGFIGGGDTKDTNIFFVDQDQLQDVYVDVPYNNENIRVFTSKIDPQVLALITESLRKANKPVTQKNIADYFVRKGQPKNVNEAFAYREEQ